MANALEAMHAGWQAIKGRFEAYALVQPGTASFICQPGVCNAHCCRAFSVSLGDEEVERMRRASSWQPVAFLESEDGDPIRLPLATPFLLARRDNHCAMLGEDLGCTQYTGRPNACRQYPHHVIFIDLALGRPVHADLPRMAAGLEGALDGHGGEVVPLLLRHLECPGFTGPPLPEREWQRLLQETAGLQYPGLRAASAIVTNPSRPSAPRAT